VKSYTELKQYTILIAEDDPIALSSLENILKRYFKKVVTASNGYEAYDQTLSESIDIILTDMRMPQQDGADFIKYLRKLDLNIPVIFMSAHTDSESLLKVIPLNITEYLIKPIQTDTVLRLCHEFFEKKGAVMNTFDPEKNRFSLKSGVSVDLKNKIIKKEDQMVLLTKKEYELLSLLIEHRYSVLEKSEIEYLLWEGEMISESSVKTLIKKLRSKIGEESIMTIKNFGYKITLL
jgi:DNA-binding response OmpR family regulator